MNLESMQIPEGFLPQNYGAPDYSPKESRIVLPRSDLFYAQHEQGSVGERLPFLAMDQTGALQLGTGLSMLKSLDKKVPLSLVSVFGAARTGKSFLLNCLAGKPGLFRCNNQHLPCTKGSDISASTNKLKSIADHVGVKVAAPMANARVAWVDCEGSGDQDVSYDTKLTMPLLISSKVIIFNHKGAPTASSMLDQLSVLARTAEGVETNRKMFGHLHLVLRDYSFDTPKAEILEKILGEEPLPPPSRLQVPRSNKRPEHTGHDPARSAKERNDIRQLLKTNFASINVWLLTQPAEPDQLKAYPELPESKVNREFVTQVHEMLRVVTEQLAETQTLTGPSTATLLTRAVQQINKDGKIRILSAMEGMEREHIKATGSFLSDRDLTVFTDQIRQRLPVSQAELQKVCAEYLKETLAQYDAKLGDVIAGDEDRAEQRKEIEEAFKLRLKELETLNLEATAKWVRHVVEREMQMFRRQFIAEAEAGAEVVGDITTVHKKETRRASAEQKEQSANVPKKEQDDITVSKSLKIKLTQDELERKFDQLKASTMTRLEVALEELPGAMQLDMTKDALWEQEEKLLELLSLYTMKRQLQEQADTELSWAQKQAEVFVDAGMSVTPVTTNPLDAAGQKLMALFKGKKR